MPIWRNRLGSRCYIVDLPGRSAIVPKNHSRPSPVADLPPPYHFNRYRFYLFIFILLLLNLWKKTEYITEYNSFIIKHHIFEQMIFTLYYTQKVFFQYIRTWERGTLQKWGKVCYGFSALLQIFRGCLQYNTGFLLSVCPFVTSSVCLSSSHTFLVVTHSYVSQATHAFLGMLPLCFSYEINFLTHNADVFRTSVGSYMPRELFW